MLKNAKDACATEELEIATYTALERLAAKVGDEQTANLAESIRADEERNGGGALERVTAQAVMSQALRIAASNNSMIAAASTSRLRPSPAINNISAAAISTK